MGIFKKSIAILLAVLMVLSLGAVMAFAEDELPPGASEYFVAGNEKLCGSNWSANDEANRMSFGEGGLSYKQYHLAAGTDYQFKITKGDWDDSANVFGKDGQNFVFNVTKECDVLITFNPETKEITVTGDGVEIPSGLNFDFITVAGDNKMDPAFLNGIKWDPSAEQNKMSTEDKKVFTITYKGVSKYEGYEFKFVINGNWDSGSWGAPKAPTEDTPADALDYDGSNIQLNVTDYDYADVTITLDLTNFDYDTKSGATYKVDIVEGKAPETTAPETTAPETTAPETTEPKESTTVAPTTNEEETTTAAPASSGDTQATTASGETQATSTEAQETTTATEETTSAEETTTATEETTVPDKPIVPGFYLVGSEEVCGAEWDWEKPWNYSTPMTASADGSYYYKVVNNVAKSDGNVTDEGPDIYVFKVVYVDERGAVTWHPDGMGNNTQVKVEEDGSTIAFTFVLLSSSPTKPNSNEAVVATVYKPGEQAPDVPTPPTAPTTTATEETTVAPATTASTAPTTVKPEPKPTTPKPSKVTTKKSNPIKVTVKTKTVKKSKLKKAKQTVKAITVKKAKGTVSYKKVSGSKKLTISKKSGKITVKKGKYKKSTLKIKVKVTAKGTKTYKSKSITKTVKVKVK